MVPPPGYSGWLPVRFFYQGDSIEVIGLENVQKSLLPFSPFLRSRRIRMPIRIIDILIEIHRHDQPRTADVPDPDHGFR